MPAIEANNLTKVYRTYRKERGLWGAVKGLAWRRYEETRAADQVSFQVGEGEFVGFLGPNGAGKSTTMRMLTCYLPPTAGTATINGFDIFHQSEQVRQNLGYLPENVPLYIEMKVEE